MSNWGLISVIVPVYKVEPYLDRCLRSIVNQTYTSLEIILIDDGSPDSCPEICDKWGERDSRIKIIHKKNGGLSDARNVGLSVATGEYVSFIDSDDWIAPEMYERLLRAMIQDESDIAACTVKVVYEDGTEGYLLTVQTNKVLDHSNAQRALLKESLIKQPVWYKLYKREVIKDIPFKIGKYHEDVFWSYQAIGNAMKVSLIDYLGYYYFQRNGSIMGEGYSMKRLDVVEAYEERAKYMSVYFPELATASRIAIIRGCVYHGQLALKYLSNDDVKYEFDILNSVLRRNRFQLLEIIRQKKTHVLWSFFAMISLELTCRIRNYIGIGF